nr:hypothetical protein [Tanacetum cinerariifolium]
AAGVDAAAGEAIADAVAIFVRHHAAVVITIELRAGNGRLGQRYLHAVPRYRTAILPVSGRVPP